MRFAIFPLHLSKVLRLPRKSEARSYEVLHLSRKIIFGKPEDLMLQNATPLRKSAPRPPNISDEHVSCTAPATENVSLQILFKCPTPAIVFGNATKPSRFAHFWQGAESLAPATRNDIWTSKSGANMWCFASKCASRHNGVHFFEHLNFQKCSEAEVFCTFNTFWLEMCFAPQRRALFRHLNFQKWSEREVLLAFSLANVLRATTACTFSTSQLLKVLRTWCVFYILTWTCASRHNSVQLFISHLATWLRTRRFSEPTFRPSGATNHWKNTVFRDFSTFSRTCIFCLLTLSLFWSSFFCSSLLWLFPPLPFHLSILSEVWLLNFLRIYRYQSFVRSHSFRAAPLWKSPCPLSCLAWDETSGNGSGATNEGPKDPKSFIWENQL